MALEPGCLRLQQPGLSRKETYAQQTVLPAATGPMPRVARTVSRWYRRWQPTVRTKGINRPCRCQRRGMPTALCPVLPLSRQLIEVRSDIFTRIPGVGLVFKRHDQVCADSTITTANPGSQKLTDRKRGVATQVFSLSDMIEARAHGR